MKINILTIFLLIFVISYGLAQDKVVLSEEPPEIKEYLVSFLKIKGDAESISDTSYLYTRRLFEKPSRDVYIISFGLMETHSKEYIFLKAANQIEIIDPNEIDEMLIEMGLFMHKTNINGADEIKRIINEIFEISTKNKNNHPSYLNKQD